MSNQWRTMTLTNQDAVKVIKFLQELSSNYPSKEPEVLRDVGSIISFLRKDFIHKIRSEMTCSSKL